MQTPRGSGIRDLSGVLRVLVVDDHDDSAELVAHVLESHGLTVRVAHNGATALEVARALLPNVALIDLNLPDMTGFELLLAVQAMESLSGCRFIAYTGDAREDVSLQISAAGFAAQLTKPIDVRDVLAVILGDDTTPSDATA